MAGKNGAPDLFLEHDLEELRGPDLPSKGDVLRFYRNRARASPRASASKIERLVAKRLIEIWAAKGFETHKIDYLMQSIKGLVNDLGDVKRDYREARGEKRREILRLWKLKCELTFLVASKSARTTGSEENRELLSAALKEIHRHGVLVKQFKQDYLRDIWRADADVNNNSNNSANGNDGDGDAPAADRRGVEEASDIVDDSNSHAEVHESQAGLEKRNSGGVVDAAAAVQENPEKPNGDEDDEDEEDDDSDGEEDDDSSGVQPPRKRARLESESADDSWSSRPHHREDRSMHLTLCFDEESTLSGASSPREPSAQQYDADASSSFDLGEQSTSTIRSTTDDDVPPSPPPPPMDSAVAKQPSSANPVVVDFDPPPPPPPPPENPALRLGEQPSSANIVAVNAAPPAPPTTESELLRALRLGDAPKFREILRRDGWPRDHSSWSDYEMLEEAAALGHLGVVEVLLAEGCRVARDAGEPTAFHEAVRRGWLHVVAEFLERGARVCQQDAAAGNTALHVAFYCAASGQMMDWLLRRLAAETDINVKNAEGLGVLQIMCTAPTGGEHLESALQRSDRYVDLAREQMPMTSGSRFAGYSLLHFAVEFDRFEVARHLLNHGAELYACEATGSTALHLACTLGRPAMVDLLFTYDELHENMVNAANLTHFMCACVGSDATVVQGFLSHSELEESRPLPAALVNCRVKREPNHPLAGLTPLDLARRHGRTEIADMLLPYAMPECRSELAALAIQPIPRDSSRKSQNVSRGDHTYCEL